MDEEPLSDISRRKEEHIRICLENNVVYDRMSNGLEKVQIRPSSFEELSVNDINLETKFLNKIINFPILISGITGGSKKGKEINEIIGKICQEFSIGMGVGSQRAAIENPELISTYQVRHIASDIPLLANLGIAQLIDEYNVNDAENAITMIKADGLALHVNIQQEFLQSEGNKDFSNLKKSISQLIKELKYPLIIKGVGSGISKKDAEYLMSLDIYAVDVAGAGGTNWAKIETYRNPDPSIKLMSSEFLNWGVSTAESILNVKSVENKRNIKVIASGGIWTGIEAIKALLLGADYVSLALPILKAINERGEKTLRTYLLSYITEMKCVMALLGARNLKELREINPIIQG